MANNTHIQLQMIELIRSDLFNSVGPSGVTKIITPSDPMRKTVHFFII